MTRPSRRACRLVAGLAAALLATTAGVARAEDPEMSDALRTPERPRGSVPPPGPDGPGAGTIALTPATGPRDIPWDRLDASVYERVRDVVAGAAVSHEVPEISFRSRKPVFDYLIDHLDFAADLARILRQGKYHVRRAGAAYEADDGHGTSGVLAPVYAEDGRRLFYLAGHYDGPLVPTLSVRGVLLLDVEHVEGSDGATYCSLRLAGHVRFDSRVVETLAWVARNYSEAQLDRQLRRFFGHVAVVSRRAYDDPRGLADELARHPELASRPVAEFVDVLVGHLPPPWSETQRFRLIDPVLSLARE